MRGSYLGRFRDKSMTMLQTEHRASIVWRIGLVAFYGMGAVAPKVSKCTVAAVACLWRGLRLLLDKKKKQNVRFDVGFTQDGTAYYLTIGEAF